MVTFGTVIVDMQYTFKEYKTSYTSEKLATGELKPEQAQSERLSFEADNMMKALVDLMFGADIRNDEKAKAVSAFWLQRRPSTLWLLEEFSLAWGVSALRTNLCEARALMRSFELTSSCLKRLLPCLTAAHELANPMLDPIEDTELHRKISTHITKCVTRINFWNISSLSSYHIIIIY